LELDILNKDAHKQGKSIKQPIFYNQAILTNQVSVKNKLNILLNNNEVDHVYSARDEPDQ